MMAILTRAVRDPGRDAPLDHTIDAPGDLEYGKPTSIEVVHTANGGQARTRHTTRNATILPGFGTPSADTRGTGPMTPTAAVRRFPGAVIRAAALP